MKVSSTLVLFCAVLLTTALAWERFGHGPKTNKHPKTNTLGFGSLLAKGVGRLAAKGASKGASTASKTSTTATASGPPKTSGKCWPAGTMCW
jgi:hypothetical protein